MKKQLLILILITFGLLQHSFGTIYYVSTSGSDGSGNGSSSNPWRTLKYAVSRVPGGQGHTIKLSTGTFVESGPIDVPTQVNIEGSGRSTVIKATSSFYYYPARPGYTITKYLIRFISPSPTNGGQSIKNLTINGDGKKLHGGILFQNRDNVRAEGLRLEYINFNGLWIWQSKNSRITNCEFYNCAWGSVEWCSGALHIGDLESVEIDNIRIDEGTGYGMKNLHFGTASLGRLTNVKIHDGSFKVNPNGLWANGKGPNIAFELWGTYLNNCEIYNNFFDNNLSLANDVSQTGKTVRVHHNIFDVGPRSNNTAYAIELDIDDVEIDNNFFKSGANGIVSWHVGEVHKNWNIHHNVFYGLTGAQWPSQALQINCKASNVKFNNNTYESIGSKTENVIGLDGGSVQNLEIRNNLFINSNTGYNLYPNRLILYKDGATVQGVVVTNNLFYKLDVGNVPGTYANNITGVNPQINASGNRPDPYYRPKSGSPLIDKGLNLGLPFLGSAPDIGAYESGSTSTTPPPPSSGSNTIVVRARGTNTSTSLQLQVNNTTVATWTMTTSMANYTASTSLTGAINVRLVDGSSGRDAQVDYIQVNGSTRQAESQTVNTGVYQNGTCGGTRSEWMHCSGYIGFGNVTSTTTTPTPSPTPSGTNTIVLRARGTNTSTSLQLQVNNTTVATWPMTTSMANYTATTSLTGAVNVRLVDGGSGKDAQIDYIQVNGVTRQAESQAVNTGVYQNGGCGGSYSEWLHCTGYIGFGNITGTSSTSASARIATTSDESAFSDSSDTQDPLIRFINPVTDNILRMELDDEEISEVRILDLSGRTMRVFVPRQERRVHEHLGLNPGTYIVQPLKNGFKKKPARLVVE